MEDFNYDSCRKLVDGKEGISFLGVFRKKAVSSALYFPTNREEGVEVFSCCRE